MNDGTRVNRLTLVVHSLSAGGAQRVVAEMANHWAKLGWDVAVVTLAGTSEDHFQLLPGVHRVALDLMRDSSHALAALGNNLRRVRRLRRAIRSCDPQVVVSFIDKTNVLTLLATWGTRIPVIVAERTDPRQHSIGRLWSWLRRRTYPLARAVVVQTESVRRALDNLGSNVHVIPNGVAAVSPSHTTAELGHESSRYIIGMGRLSPEKGFDRLIDAWSMIADEHPSWKLRIYGEGPERSQLENLVQRQATRRVELPGQTTEPEMAYSTATIFVLPSLYEGFPNALLEAMACGLPVISFDCPSGPAEIIRHEVDGLLVPASDTEALAQAMDWLISDSVLRETLGRRAREVSDRFSTAESYRRWEELIGRLAAAAR